jgi:hypothetical protein
MQLGYLNQNNEGPHVMKPRLKVPHGPWQPIPDTAIWDARPKVFGVTLKKQNPRGYRLRK